MYHAKAHHLGHTRYSAELDEATPERVALLPDLRHAIVTGGLELHYQPKLDVGGHGAHAVEALARWTHPERGPVAPDVFVPLAEQTGLVGDLTRWVLRTALAQCRTWEDDGLVLDVAVNVSVHDLRDAGLVDLVLRLLARHRLAPERLILEVTETALMADPQRARSTLDALRGLGVRIAIDDFGTGQSSLAYLRGLAASELKIDRTFVRDLSTDAGNEAIVRTTIALAHELGLRVVAEGVEDAPTLALLGEAGCDEAQGWLIGRPVPADAVPAALRAADPRALAV
jgi:EAL domain-containing protein (putative c-di-GMP-specific phosphodiesterase class I)